MKNATGKYSRMDLVLLIERYAWMAGQDLARQKLWCAMWDYDELNEHEGTNRIEHSLPDIMHKTVIGFWARKLVDCIYGRDIDDGILKFYDILRKTFKEFDNETVQ
jgi:hypothetical protein